LWSRFSGFHFMDHILRLGSPCSLPLPLGPGKAPSDRPRAPRTIFRRALQRGNLMVAETMVREIGVVSLSEPLELTALIAKHERPRLARLGARWLQRWLDETPGQALEEISLVLACLSELGGRHHDEALAALRGIASTR